MAKFLNTILSQVLGVLETPYTINEVFDVDDANVVLNDLEESDFPVAFFTIKNSGSITLTRHRKSYPSYDVSVWFLDMYDEDNKEQLDTCYKGLRLDALEFEQRLQRTEAFAKVPTNTVINPSHEEFDADLDILACVLQTTFSISIDIEEDTSRVCALGSMSSFTLDDSNLDSVLIDASNSSFRGVAQGANGGTHAWVFNMNGEIVSVSGLAVDNISESDVFLLDAIGVSNITGTYNSFAFQKNPQLSIELNFEIDVSHTYDFRSNGGVSDATSNIVAKREFFKFNTLWDNSEDGDFSILMQGTSGVAIFGSEEVSFDGLNPLTYDGDYLNGTNKEVSISISDFNDVNLLRLESSKITGILNLSLFTGILNDLRVENSASGSNLNTVTSITMPDAVVNDLSCISQQITSFEGTISGTLRINNSPLLEEIVLLEGSETTSVFIQSNSVMRSYENRGSMIGGFASFSSPLFTDITISSGDTNNLGGSISFRCLLEVFDLGDYIIDGEWSSFSFGETNTTQSDLDNAWIEIRRVAVPTIGSPVIDGSRPTALPSSTSDNARFELIILGYSLTI